MIGRRVVVDEQVRQHRLADALHPRLAEPDPEPAADHDRLRVEQVDRGGDAGAERLDGLLEQLERHLVVAGQRALPDAGGEPVAAALLHDLEQRGLLALLDAPARAGLHRAAAGVGLHAAAAAAAALGAVDAHDHVADLARGLAADPRLAVEDQAAADAGAPEDAEQAVVLACGADLELGVGGEVDVVAERDGRAAELLLERLAQVERAGPLGEVHGAGDGALLVVDAAGRADADAGEVGRRSSPASSSDSSSTAAMPRGDRLRAALERRLVALGAEDLVVGALVHDRGLDLRAAEVDAAVDRHGWHLAR